MNSKPKITDVVFALVLALLHLGAIALVLTVVIPDSPKYRAYLVRQTIVECRELAKEMAEAGFMAGKYNVTFRCLADRQAAIRD